MLARPLFALLVLPAATASAQGLSWEPLPQGAAVPSARQMHTLVFDSHRQRTVLFGGSDANSIPKLDATWEWTGSNWTQCIPANSPPARYGHSAAYDSARQRTVIFGGRDTTQQVLSDTWEWDGTAWLPAPPGSAPVARIHSAMAFDSARQRTVLFGGWTTGSVILGDTWEWDGSVWSQRATNGASARSAHAMVYDAHAQRTLMFGGSNPSTSQRNDLWAWDGTTWTQLSPNTSVPGERHHHTMVYDSLRQATLVCGGAGAGGALLSDTWTWDGTTWSVYQGAPINPARAFAAACYHGTRGRDFLFGGRDGAIGTSSETVLADAWETSKAASYPWGSGCSGTNGIPTLAAAPGSLPVLGAPFSLVLANLPTSLCVAIPFVGFDTNSTGGIPLPRDLAPLGMPGCTQYVDPFQVWFLLVYAPTGTTTWSPAIPNIASFSGVQVHFQAAITDLPANSLGLTATNAVTATLGW